MKLIKASIQILTPIGSGGYKGAARAKLTHEPPIFYTYC